MSMVFAWHGAVTASGFTVACEASASETVGFDVATDAGFSSIVFTDSFAATANTPHKFAATGLTANTTYYWRVAAGASEIEGQCKTFPSGAADLVIAVASCAGQGEVDGASDSTVFSHLAARGLDLFVHMGDLHYREAATATGFRTVLSKPNQALLYRSVPFAYSWDDHDYGGDNSGLSYSDRLTALAAYRDYVPHYPLLDADADTPIFQDFTIGRLRFVMPDCRSERASGGVTRLGAQQMTRLGVILDEAMAATYGLVIYTGVPWISASGSDTWHGAAAQRAEIAEMIAARGLTNRVLFIAGDMHAVAIDNGEHNTYAAAWSPGPPVLQAAALDATGSSKGGPYTFGPSTGGDRFGLIEVDDPGGSQLQITLKGISVSGGVETLRMSYSFLMDFEGVSTVLKDYQASWSTVRAVERDRAELWDVINSVEQDLVTQWDNGQAYAENTLTVAWDSGGSLTRDFVPAYSVSGWIESSYAPNWTVLATTENDLEPLWDVRTSAEADGVFTWNTIAGVSSDFVDEWNVTEVEAVSRDLALVWHLANVTQVSSDLAPFWYVLDAVSIDLVPAWDMNLPVPTGTWFPKLTGGAPTWSSELIEWVASDYVSTWSDLASTSRDLDVSYHVAEVGEIDGGGYLPDPILADYSPVWEIGEPTADFSPLWDVHNAVEQDFADAWDAVQAVTADFTPAFSVLNPSGVVSNDLVPRWEVSASIQQDLVLSWNAVKAVQVDLASVWAAAGYVEGDYSPRWVIGDKVMADLQLVWDILTAAVEGDYEVVWDVDEAANLDPAGRGVAYFEVIEEPLAFEVAPDMARFEVASEAAPELTD